MTIDEIIKHYEQVLKELKAYKEQSGDCISRQAAISAIMGEYPDAHYPSYYKSKIDELPSITPQPCEDAVSRQAVLEGIRNLYPDIPVVDIMGARRKWLDKYAPYFECENVVEQLSSVTPQQVLDKIKTKIDQKQYDFMRDGDYDEGIRFGLMLAYQIISQYDRK
jgi:hypothetical protein